VKLQNVGEIIAGRKFKLLCEGHQGEAVVVALGKPQHMHDQTDFHGS